jgi:hypothetical protein
LSQLAGKAPLMTEGVSRGAGTQPAPGDETFTAQVTPLTISDGSVPAGAATTLSVWESRSVR